MFRKLLLFLLALPLVAAPPVRVLLVTGGHDHEPSLYALFDKDPEIQTTVDPHLKDPASCLESYFCGRG